MMAQVNDTDEARNIEKPNFVEIFAVYGHTEMVTALKFSCNEELLASGAADGSIKVWNVETSKIHKHLVGHKVRVMDFCWSKDNTLLVSASFDRKLRIWDVVSGKCFKILLGHTSGVFRCNFHPNSSLIVSGSTGGEIYIWDVKTGICIKNLDSPTHGTHRITSVCFNKDGTFIISGNAAGLLCTWNMATNVCFSTIIRDPISSINFIASEDCIAVATYTGRLELWNFAQSLGNVSRSISFSVVNDYVATSKSPTNDLWVISKSQSEHALNIWSYKARRLVQKLKCHTDTITCVTCHPTTHMIATAAFGHDNRIKIWKHHA